MPRYEGPCIDCGAPLDKYVQPGRKPVCVECGIQRSADWNRAMANGTNPHSQTRAEAGRKAAAQIKARQGPAYEAWLRGMRAVVGVTTTTESETSDTVPT
jgi:hypothetical protein